MNNPAAVIADLRLRRNVSDFDFDQVYARKYRRFSTRHWTPVEVAQRAAELLVKDSSTRVLDVGSGVGKFCLVGALTTPGQFTGVEQRLELVQAAKAVVEQHRIARVSFRHASVEKIDWAKFDSIYLFNPFYENFLPSIRIDDELPMDEQRYVALIQHTCEQLAQTHSGTRVATYHGFGAKPPTGFRLELREPIATDAIELWVKE